MTDDDGAIPEDRDDVDSGPFCRHWDDLGCDRPCLACGHRCGRHDAGDPGECMECDCHGFTEAPE